MTTFTSYDQARDYMNRCNRLDDAEVVLVEGPENGEYTIMSMAEAIDADFCYEYASGY